MSKQGPSTSFPSPQWKYDVFLSFRGDDTRKGFTDHLYTSLEHHGIRTFKDDQELHKGKAISPELMTAIQESRFALIVLSPHYASSTWCLDELAHIVNCMEERGAVMPIFYDVNPSDVRKQTGTFATAFTIHERFQNDGMKVQSWRSTLTKVANLSGWNSRDWNNSCWNHKPFGSRVVAALYQETYACMDDPHSDSPWMRPNDRDFFDVPVKWGLAGLKRIFGSLGN